MIIIDGISYNVDIISMKAKADMLDKYAERTVDGELRRELIGVYDNYEISFAAGFSNTADYAALWWKLTEPVEFHDVVFPTMLGSRTITGYFSGTQHELVKIKDGVQYWKSLSTSFVSKSRRPV